MACCLLLIRKLKTNAELISAYSHMESLVHIHKEDKAWEKVSRHMISVPEGDIVRAWRVRLAALPFYNTHKFRKNGVMAYDIRLGYSKEAAERMDDEGWEAANLAWLNDTFGEKNTIALTFHEYSWHGAPYLHGHAIVMPVDEKTQLNAFKYTGKKYNLVQLQDSYALAMEPFGLERGLRYAAGNQAPPRDYYAKLTNPLYGVDLPAKLEGESDAEYNERIKAAWRTERAAHEREQDVLKQRLATAGPRFKTEGQLDSAIRSRKAELLQLQEDRTKTAEMFGSEEAAAGLASAWALLQHGLEKYPDRDYAQHARRDIEKVMKNAKK